MSNQAEILCKSLLMIVINNAKKKKEKKRIKYLSK